MDRINKLCSYLQPCVSFADVGCDHGYCTLYMLKNGLCESAVISDVSAKCLQKAEKLLKSYISSGKVTAVCADGLGGIKSDTDEVLIAGMGGDEIVEILKNAFIPANFVLQPMKNPRAVREFLLSSGALITADEVFESGGKFYTVIKGKNSGNSNIYTDVQLEYGYNLHSAAAVKYLSSELEKKRGYLKREMNAAARNKIEGECRKIEEVLKGENS